MASVDAPYPEEIRNKALEWRIRIEGDDVAPDERIEFEKWLAADFRHQQAYDRAETVWASFATLDDSKMDARLFSPSLGDSIRSALIGLQEKLKTPMFQTGAFATGVAAVAVIFIVATDALSPKGEPYSPEPPVVTAHATGLGEFKSITLSDDSDLTLGPATAITVSMSDNLREITLSKGAVLFDVAPDKARPFRVRAESFTATAIGTVFDVRNNGGVVRLSVSEGAVEAAHPVVINDRPSAMLSRRTIEAGNQVAVSSDEGFSEVGRLRPDTFAAWRSDRLRYVAAPLRELIADANRYSEIPIVVSQMAGDNGLDDIKVTFSFDGNDVDAMLEILPELFPVTVDASRGDQIIIREKPQD